MATIQRAVIAGGKTGGHLYPGIAVAEELQARYAGAAVTFIGTVDGIESRVLPRLGYALETIDVSRLKGGGILGKLVGLARIPVAMVQSFRLLRRLRPQVVLGVGGYASGPALLTAWMMRYPTAIQEQNAHAGFTNRVLGRLTRAIYLGFDAAAGHFGGAATVATGNPIRRALVEQLEAATSAAAEARAGEALHVLIFGGSQGARFLNEHVPAALAALRTARPDLQLVVTHQTGKHDEDATRARYAEGPLAAAATVTAYIDDMPSAYAAADVAITRAGALTVAELTAVGLPALLVPFPFAADDHQTANARVMADAGAGRLVRQRDWDQAQVVEWLAGLAGDRDALRAMSAAARSLARPQAASALVDHLETIADAPSRAGADGGGR